MRLGKKLSVVSVLGFVASSFCAQPAWGQKQLTVERIYARPSLSGSLYSGLAWTPDGKSLTFLEAKGKEKSLWIVSAATGEKKQLLSAEKLESVLPEDKSKPTQATGLGRRAP